MSGNWHKNKSERIIKTFDNNENNNNMEPVWNLLAISIKEIYYYKTKI